ncbi:MAG: peptide deformylase [Candidatus Omnitrophica bacterium]|nr:peptide deformylase [Candidatus Omnitrophota bacterium]
MSILKVIKYPNPLLRRSSRHIDLIKEEDKRLADDMLETMYLNHGVGLAAPQMGISKRIIVIDVGDGPIKLINPEVVERRGSATGDEGCLSLPGIMVTVKRSEKIRYKGLDGDGKVIEGEAEGLLSKAIQHEIDHLNGKLVVDYANPIKRLFLKKKLLKTPNF